jgi:hypothetical protein
MGKNCVADADSLLATRLGKLTESILHFPVCLPDDEEQISDVGQGIASVLVPALGALLLTEIWRRRVVALFLDKSLLNPDFARKLLGWEHSGFSVDNSVRLDGDDHTARQALAQYIARAPLSLQKLTYDRAGGKILYHTSYNQAVDLSVFSENSIA